MWDVYGLGFRAGYWRRSLAQTIDGTLVVLPLQVIAIALYVATGSLVPDLRNACSSLSKLDPPPTFANLSSTLCDLSRFQLAIPYNVAMIRIRADALLQFMPRVSNVPEDGKAKGILFSLIAGAPIAIWLAYISYLVAMEHRRGATIGERLLRTSVVSWKAPGERGIPLSDALIRHLASGLGILPLIVIEIHQFVMGGGKNMYSIIAGVKVSWTLMAILFSLFWSIWNLILIVAKRDPIYDRLARVSVLCD
jgi:hypothetical protein